MEIHGKVEASKGCLTNQGPARGVSLFYTLAKCAGGGGSSAGQGGTGIAVNDSQRDEDCFKLSESVKFMAKLHPYVGMGQIGPGSGGGQQLTQDAQSQTVLDKGYGGGYMILSTESTMVIEGTVSANGAPGYQSEVFNGGGAGGTILIQASSI